MKINIVCVGTLKEKFYINAIEEYSKRLSRFVSLKIIELPQCKIDDINQTLKFEEQKILDALEGYIVLMDIGGKQMTSPELAKTIKNIEISNSTITFIIGGSFGVSQNVRDRANMRLSFSSLTFPHQLFRVMLLEQIYRAYTINNNMPYHK